MTFCWCDATSTLQARKEPGERPRNAQAVAQRDGVRQLRSQDARKRAAESAANKAISTLMQADAKCGGRLNYGIFWHSEDVSGGRVVYKRFSPMLKVRTHLPWRQRVVAFSDFAHQFLMWPELMFMPMAAHSEHC